MRTGRLVLGSVALASFALSLSAYVVPFDRLRGATPPAVGMWLTRSPYGLALGYIIGLIVSFGLWRLAVGRRWSNVLLTAASLSLASVVFGRFILNRLQLDGGVRTTRLFFALNLLAVVAGLLLAVGLLLTDIVPSWVAWLGIAARLIGAPPVLWPRAAMDVMVSSNTSLTVALSQSSHLLGLAFSLSLAVALMFGLTPHEPASNKRFEQTRTGLG